MKLQHIQDAVKFFRKINGLSRKALSEKAGMHVNTLVSFETRKSDMCLDKFIALSRALDITPGGLLEAAQNLATGSGRKPRQ